MEVKWVFNICVMLQSLSKSGGLCQTNFDSEQYPRVVVVLNINGNVKLSVKYVGIDGYNIWDGHIYFCMQTEHRPFAPNWTSYLYHNSL